jgi:hypothetical protein
VHINMWTREVRRVCDWCMYKLSYGYVWKHNMIVDTRVQWKLSCRAIRWNGRNHNYFVFWFMCCRSFWLDNGSNLLVVHWAMCGWIVRIPSWGDCSHM